MLNKLLLTTALVATSGTAGLAQGFTGAELGIEFSNALDGEDLGGVSYYASGEYALAYGVSIALDGSVFDYDIGVSDLSNLTAHLIYGVNAATSVGLFYGQDNVGDEEITLLGAEVAYDFGIADVEAYLGSGDDSVDDVTIYGVSANYGLTPDIALVANLDGFSGNDFGSSAIEFGGIYTLPQGPQLGATVGRLSIDSGAAEESATFFGIQARIAIGPNVGTTFGRRGIFEVSKSGP